jgi:hypothetical protein
MVGFFYVFICPSVYATIFVMVVRSSRSHSEMNDDGDGVMAMVAKYPQ